MARELRSALDAGEFLRRTIGEKALIDYPKDQIVYAQGDLADSVFYITSGSVKVSVTSRQGKQAIVAILKRGSFFGEESAVGQQKRIATVSATEQSMLLRIEKPTIIRLLRDEPTFAALFIEYLVTRTNRVQEDLIDQRVNSSEKRLARLLLRLANFAKEDRLISCRNLRDWVLSITTVTLKFAVPC